MNFSWKAHSRLWLTLFVILGVVIALTTLVNAPQVIRILARTEWSILLPAMLVLVLGYALLATLWRYLLLNRPGWYSGFHATNIGNLINILSPIPASPIRIVIMSTDPAVSLPMATSSALLVRLLEMVMRAAVVGDHDLAEHPGRDRPSFDAVRLPAARRGANVAFLVGPAKRAGHPMGNRLAVAPASHRRSAGPRHHGRLDAGFSRGREPGSPDPGLADDGSHLAVLFRLSLPLSPRRGRSSPL